MPITITMPVLSPTMQEGTISKWLKKVNDQVKPGDVLCEIQTDKATIEFQSSEEGYLLKIVKGDGSLALVNQAIAVLGAKDENIADYLLEEPNLKKALVEKPESGKKEITPEPSSVKPAAVTLGMTFEPAPPRTSYRFPDSDPAAHIAISPRAKNRAEAEGLDLRSIQGSGPGGRIIESDLKSAQKLNPASATKGQLPTLPPGSYEEESLTQIRKVIGERLLASKHTTPHCYFNDEVRACRLVDLREQLKEMGIKLTFNDFVIRAVALALRKHPDINSGYNSKENKIIRFKTVDISLAVSISDGLITPIICHADYKDIHQLSYEAKELAKKAKEKTLKPEEYQGGSFTISNLGMFGINSFSAIINPPQAAILAVGAIQEKPICHQNKIIPGHTLGLTLSADHRVIDGATAALFLKTVKTFLENPALLLV